MKRKARSKIQRQELEQEMSLAMSLKAGLDAVTACAACDWLEDNAGSIQAERGVWWEAGFSELTDKMTLAAMSNNGSTPQEAAYPMKFWCEGEPKPHMPDQALWVLMSTNLSGVRLTTAPDQDATTEVVLQRYRQWRDNLLEAAYLRWADPEAVAVLQKRLSCRMAMVPTHKKAPLVPGNHYILGGVKCRIVPCFERAALVRILQFARVSSTDHALVRYLGSPAHPWQINSNGPFSERALKDVVIWATKSWRGPVVPPYYIDIIAAEAVEKTEAVS